MRRGNSLACHLSSDKDRNGYWTLLPDENSLKASSRNIGKYMEVIHGAEAYPDKGVSELLPSQKRSTGDMFGLDRIGYGYNLIKK